MDGVELAVMIIVVYDIASNNRRAKVAAALQAVGDRIQESVFAAQLSTDDQTKLIETLTELIDPTQDSVYLAKQCVTCWGGLTQIGQARRPSEAHHWAIM